MESNKENKRKRKRNKEERKRKDNCDDKEYKQHFEGVSLNYSVIKLPFGAIIASRQKRAVFENNIAESINTTVASELRTWEGCREKWQKSK